MKFKTMSLIGIVALSMLTACGKDASKTPIATNTQNVTTDNYDNSQDGLGDGSTTTLTGYEPAFSYDFDLNSGNSFSFMTDAMDTDSILKVQITAGPAGQNTVPGYESWNLNYGCIQYKVSMYQVVDGKPVKNGQSVLTNVLAVPGGSSWLCPKAKNSQVIDFSPRLGGDKPVVIEISEARYDLYCQMWWNAYNRGGYWSAYYGAGAYGTVCPTKLVYKNHTVSGSVAVQVNGTYIE